MEIRQVPAASAQENNVNTALSQYSGMEKGIDCLKTFLESSKIGSPFAQFYELIRNVGHYGASGGQSKVSYNDVRKLEGFVEYYIPFIVGISAAPDQVIAGRDAFFGAFKSLIQAAQKVGLNNSAQELSLLILSNAVLDALLTFIPGVKDISAQEKIEIKKCHKIFEDAKLSREKTLDGGAHGGTIPTGGAGSSSSGASGGSGAPTEKELQDAVDILNKWKIIGASAARQLKALLDAWGWESTDGTEVVDKNGNVIPLEEVKKKLLEELKKFKQQNAQGSNAQQSFSATSRTTQTATQGVMESIKNFFGIFSTDQKVQSSRELAIITAPDPHTPGPGGKDGAWTRPTKSEPLAYTPDLASELPHMSLVEVWITLILEVKTTDEDGNTTITEEVLANLAVSLQLYDSSGKLIGTMKGLMTDSAGKASAQMAVPLDAKGPLELVASTTYKGEEVTTKQEIKYTQSKEIKKYLKALEKEETSLATVQESEAGNSRFVIAVPRVDTANKTGNEVTEVTIVLPPPVKLNDTVEIHNQEGQAIAEDRLQVKENKNGETVVTIKTPEAPLQAISFALESQGSEATKQEDKVTITTTITNPEAGTEQQTITTIPIIAVPTEVPAPTEVAASFTTVQNAIGLSSEDMQDIEKGKTVTKTNTEENTVTEITQNQDGTLDSTTKDKTGKVIKRVKITIQLSLIDKIMKNITRVLRGLTNMFGF